MNSFDYLFRFIIVGDSNVGKSCLLLQFTDNNFRNQHETTIGVEFGSKTITNNNKKIKVQIWDTAGQDSFRSITRSYYRGAIGGLIVYDVTSRESFDSINRWLGEIENHANEKIVLSIVGNKADLTEQRQVSFQEGMDLAKKHNLRFFETSAKTGMNVENTFLFTSVEIISRIESGKLEPSEEQGIRISQSKPPQEETQGDDGEKKSRCC